MRQQMSCLLIRNSHSEIESIRRRVQVEGKFLERHLQKHQPRNVNKALAPPNPKKKLILQTPQMILMKMMTTTGGRLKRVIRGRVNQRKRKTNRRSRWQAKKVLPRRM